MHIGCRLMKPEHCPLYTPEGELSPQYTGAVEAEYWIDFGSVRYLRFSDELIRHWRETQPLDDRGLLHQPGIGVWFFTDVIFSQIQAAFADVPPDIAKWLESPEAIDKFYAMLAAWDKAGWAIRDPAEDDGYPPNDEILETVHEACFWWCGRGENPTQAISDARITFWRTGDLMRFHWLDTSRYEDTAMPIWRDQLGFGAVDLRTFEKEVRRAWKQLMEESPAQIARVAEYARKKTGIDFEETMLKRFREYNKDIEEYFVPSSLPWDEIRAAYEKVMSWGEAPEVVYDDEDEEGQSNEPEKPEG